MNCVYENFLPTSSTVRQCSYLLNQIEKNISARNVSSRIIRLNSNQYRAWIKIEKLNGEHEVTTLGKSVNDCLSEAIDLAKSTDRKFENIITN